MKKVIKASEKLWILMFTVKSMIKKKVWKNTAQPRHYLDQAIKKGRRVGYVSKSQFQHWRGHSCKHYGTATRRRKKKAHVTIFIASIPTQWYHHSYDQAWWWSYHALGLIFSRRNWNLIQATWMEPSTQWANCREEPVVVSRRLSIKNESRFFNRTTCRSTYAVGVKEQLSKSTALNPKENLVWHLKPNT